MAETSEPQTKEAGAEQTKPKRQRVASMGQRTVRGILLEIRESLKNPTLTAEQRADLFKQAREWGKRLDAMPRENSPNRARKTDGKGKTASKPDLFA